MIASIVEQVHAFLKRLTSYRKALWQLDDYPIRVKEQVTTSVTPQGRWRPIPWSAQIVNWWQMAGHGNTREEALANLRASFAGFRDSHDRLPRPGTGAPLEFAFADVVKRHEEVARDFLTRILGLNYDECIISDESSLWDFHTSDTNDEYYRKIMLLYRVDVTDIEGAKLGAIFERIARHSSAV